MASENVACDTVEIARNPDNDEHVDVTYYCRKIADASPVIMTVTGLTPDQVVPSAPISQGGNDYTLVDALPG